MVVEKVYKKDIKNRRKKIKENNKKLYKSKRSNLIKLGIISFVVIVSFLSVIYVKDVVALTRKDNAKKYDLAVLTKQFKDKDIEFSEVSKDKNLEFAIREKLRYVGEGEIYFSFDEDEK